MDIKKSYYAVIPANVRYDEELTPNAKLLYGEITALTNEKGYCWAGNSYFAELYKVTTVSVSKWVSQLAKKGYLNTEIIYREGTKEIKERRIYVGTPHKEIFNTPIKEKFKTSQRNLGGPHKEIFNTPIKEKFKDNNTSFNNTINTTVNKELQKNCNDEIDLKFLEGDVEIELSRFMINEMLRIKPDSKVPNSDLKSLQNWGQQIDYMLRIDGRNPRDIAELFRWTQESDFWVANIRSPRKLREKWDTLELQRDRNKPRIAKNISSLEEMYQKAKAEEEGI